MSERTQPAFDEDRPNKRVAAADLFGPPKPSVDWDGSASKRFAYADPPYPGQARLHYRNHQDYAGEVDHAALLLELEAFDGWALSTSAAALQTILSMCPPGVRIGVWYRTNSAHPGNRGRWWWSWEPVIFHGWRDDGIVFRDVLKLPFDRSLGLPGAKPKLFCEWVFHGLGLRPEDKLHDLFPGTGAVASAWEIWRSQTRLAV